MANGAKVCSEPCDRDLGQHTVVARTQFGSQHVLRKIHGSDWARTLVLPAVPAPPAPVTKPIPPGLRGAFLPCFWAQKPFIPI